MDGSEICDIVVTMRVLGKQKRGEAKQILGRFEARGQGVVMCKLKDNHLLGSWISTRACPDVKIHGDGTHSSS